MITNKFLLVFVAPAIWSVQLALFAIWMLGMLCVIAWQALNIAYKWAYIHVMYTYCMILGIIGCGMNWNEFDAMMKRHGYKE